MSALSSTFWTHYPERRSAQAHPCAVHRFLRFGNVPRIDYQSRYYSGTTYWYRGLAGYRKTSMSGVIPASSSLSSPRRPDSTIKRLRSQELWGEATGLNSIGSLSPKAADCSSEPQGKNVSLRRVFAGGYTPCGGFSRRTGGRAFRVVRTA